MEKINLSEMYLDDEIKKSVLDILESGIYVKGEHLKRFEREFADFCSAGHAIGVSSGSAALLLSLLALDIGKGDEVIVPSHTFIATASSVVFLHAKPVFVDIDPETYNIDPEKIKEGISPKTKAIIPVHLYGHPADMDPMNEIAKDNDLYVIEDACQAHGALYKGKKVGAIGDVGCFSFYPSKNMTVCGDGGMVVTNDSELAEKITMLRDHGRKDKYLHEILGLNFRLSEIHSAIGREQLKHLPEWVGSRREVAKKYGTLLEDIQEFTLPVEKEYARHVYHLYVIRFHKRDLLKKHLEKKGVSAGIHYPIPVHKQPVMQKLNLKEKLPITEKYVKEILSLPIHPQLSEEDIQHIVKEIGEFYR